MSSEIHPSSTDEQTSVRKWDLLDDPVRIDVRYIAAAVEEYLDVERERDTHERLPIRGERVLLDNMVVDPCQCTTIVEEVDLGATNGRVNADRKQTHIGENGTEGECELSLRRLSSQRGRRGDSECAKRKHQRKNEPCEFEYGVHICLIPFAEKLEFLICSTTAITCSFHILAYQQTSFLRFCISWPPVLITTAALQE